MRLLAAALTVGLLGSGCLGAFEGSQDRRGGAGFACYHDLECEPPLTCQAVGSKPSPACSGTAALGEACSGSVACRYDRNERGLPLACGADGLCAYPASEPAS